MVVLDINVVIEKVRKGEEIFENIIGVIFVEFFCIVRYLKFRGDVFFFVFDDFIFVYKF